MTVEAFNHTWETCPLCRGIVMVDLSSNDPSVNAGHVEALLMAKVKTAGRLSDPLQDHLSAELSMACAHALSFARHIHLWVPNTSLGAVSIDRAAAVLAAIQRSLRDGVDPLHGLVAHAGDVSQLAALGILQGPERPQ